MSAGDLLVLLLAGLAPFAAIAAYCAVDLLVEAYYDSGADR